MAIDTYIESHYKVVQTNGENPSVFLLIGRQDNLICFRSEKSLTDARCNSAFINTFGTKEDCVLIPGFPFSGRLQPSCSQISARLVDNTAKISGWDSNYLTKLFPGITSNEIEFAARIEQLVAKFPFASKESKKRIITEATRYEIARTNLWASRASTYDPLLQERKAAMIAALKKAHAEGGKVFLVADKIHLDQPELYGAIKELSYIVLEPKEEDSVEVQQERALLQELRAARHSQLDRRYSLRVGQFLSANSENCTFL